MRRAHWAHSVYLLTEVETGPDGRPRPSDCIKGVNLTRQARSTLPVPRIIFPAFLPAIRASPALRHSFSPSFFALLVSCLVLWRVLLLLGASVRCLF